MYPWQSTPEAVHAERQRLLAWQTQIIQQRDDADQPVYQGRVPVPSAQRLPQLMRAIGCPAQTCERRLTEFTSEPLLGAASTWVQQQMNGDTEDLRQGMALLGVPSTGKTSLGVAVLRSAAWNNKTVKFVDIETFAKFHTAWIEMSQNSARYDDYAERGENKRRGVC